MPCRLATSISTSSLMSRAMAAPWHLCAALERSARCTDATQRSKHQLHSSTACMTASSCNSVIDQALVIEWELNNNKKSHERLWRARSLFELIDSLRVSSFIIIHLLCVVELEA
jgi:hypothetical protein